MCGFVPSALYWQTNKVFSEKLIFIALSLQAHLKTWIEQDQCNINLVNTVSKETAKFKMVLTILSMSNKWSSKKTKSI